MPNRRSITLTDLYKTFPYKNQLNKIEYATLCKTFNHIMMDHIMQTGRAVKLPSQLGWLEVRKYKRERPSVDFKHYIESGGEIRSYKNRHSSDYTTKILWNTLGTKSNVRHKALYRFRPTRFNNRKLARLIKQQNTINKYFEYE